MQIESRQQTPRDSGGTDSGEPKETAAVTIFSKQRDKEVLPLNDEIEPFVDASRVGEFLQLMPRRVLELTRAGKLPGHPLGDGSRRVWRFRLSEISAAIENRKLSKKSAIIETGGPAVPTRKGH